VLFACVHSVLCCVETCEECCICVLCAFYLLLLCSEEVLTFLFLLHRENGDFSILMKDILLCSECGSIEVFSCVLRFIL
jgi:hypothetical protein